MLGALIGPNRCWGSKSASRAQILPQWSLNAPQVVSRSEGSGKWAAQIGEFRIGGQNQSPESRMSPANGVTQRIVSWGRSRDGSEFARGNKSVDTEGFCKSQMTLNSGFESVPMPSISIATVSPALR